MALQTHSKWYFDYVISLENNALDFSEGGPEIQTTINIGSYTLESLAVEIERALNDAGTGETYTVTVNRTTRAYTISGTSNFEILSTTGSRSGTGCYSVIGFSGADKTGSNTYTGVSTGKVYVTQFKLQDYIPFEHDTGANQGTVNESASGQVEVVKFGTKQIMECNLMFVTSRITNSKLIRDDAQGKEKLLEFLNYLITKAPVEFMPDENNSSTFYKCLLESTGKDKNGIRFQLKEMINKNLPDFYESQKLTFRLLND